MCLRLQLLLKCPNRSNTVVHHKVGVGSIQTGIAVERIAVCVAFKVEGSETAVAVVVVVATGETIAVVVVRREVDNLTKSDICHYLNCTYV